jgi:predicted metal-dependent hydrolase
MKHRSRRLAPSQPPSPVLVDMGGIAVRITRKQVKNLRIRVAASDGCVEASVPAFMPLSQVERFVVGKREWIEQRKAILEDSPQARAERATPAEIAEWRAAVEASVPAVIERWEPIMGVRAGRLAYRNMTSRWGSCQPATGRICINVRLALYPPRCLEYIVVHELCHLLEPGHGARFRSLMDGFLPDWKESRDLLGA